MGDKKHIDRLFQERFKDFEVSPSDTVWAGIEKELQQNKKKRRVIPIWWRYAGVAALLLIFLTIKSAYLSHTVASPNNVVDSEQTRSAQPDLKNNSTLNNNAVVNTNETNENITLPLKPSNLVSATQRNETLSHLSNKKKTHKGNQNNPVLLHPSNSSLEQKLTETKDSGVSKPKTASSNQESIKETNKIANQKNDEKNKHLKTIEEALDENSMEIATQKVPSKWQIAPNAAPVYFNTLGQGSTIDPQFNNNSKTGEVNMSYGINASYALNEKIKVRSGINKVNLGYSTNNVIVYSSAGLSSAKSSLENINAGTNGTASNISIISGEHVISAPGGFETSNTSINQSFGYIEIPLEIEYALINKKFGLQLIGGFSSLFLNNNQVFSEAENGTKTLLGKANNINNISYSANFGFGLNYNVSKKIDLNVEPMFKYQINTFNNTSGDFKPFFIGVYTGFAIKF